MVYREWWRKNVANSFDQIGGGESHLLKHSLASFSRSPSKFIFTLRVLRCSSFSINARVQRPKTALTQLYQMSQDIYQMSQGFFNVL